MWVYLPVKPHIDAVGDVEYSRVCVCVCVYVHTLCWCVYGSAILVYAGSSQCAEVGSNMLCLLRYMYVRILYHYIVLIEAVLMQNTFHSYSNTFTI